MVKRDSRVLVRWLRHGNFEDVRFYPTIEFSIFFVPPSQRCPCFTLKFRMNGVTSQVKSRVRIFGCARTWLARQ